MEIKLLVNKTAFTNKLTSRVAGFDIYSLVILEKVTKSCHQLPSILGAPASKIWNLANNTVNHGILGYSPNLNVINEIDSPAPKVFSTRREIMRDDVFGKCY